MTIRRYRMGGRVQGVGFRAFVARRARTLGVTGAVRNEADGTVTVVAQGDENAIEALRAELASGPPGARVAAIDEDDLAEWPRESFDLRF